MAKKREVPKELQNIFFDKIEEMVEKYDKAGGTWNRFAIKNMMIQSMAHGYYLSDDKAKQSNKELKEALDKLLPILEAERVSNGISLTLRYQTEYRQAKEALKNNP